ncbi:MAG: NAD-dependent epimerase/dehydratase, partial [Candidatus Levybacteria bacterium]|nr:NAD-dependent epimerase/dehydratase [Candidatus Levybacteria bacterium]
RALLDLQAPVAANRGHEESGEEGFQETLHFLEGSLEDIPVWADNLKQFRPEAAIHLAWEGIPDYGAEMSTKNLKYGLDLFKLLYKTGCKTILATGSVWEYGKLSGELSEDLFVEPFNPFTAAKNSLNWMGREMAKEYGTNFIWTRLFYVYGPGQKSTSLIPYLINCIKEGNHPEIRNPDAKNDFIYVEDVADAVSKLILHYSKSGIFNIGSGQLTSVKTILNIIYNLFSKKEDYKKADQIQTDALSANYANISKIEKEVGWKPQTNIEKGIKGIIQPLTIQDRVK